MDQAFLDLCKEACEYVALYADRNRSGHAPVFLRQFRQALNEQQTRLIQERPPQENTQ
jgi:hypothetical protein